MKQDDLILLDVAGQYTVAIETRPDIAPQTVQRIKELVQQGFFDGASFHRVDERIVQTGDPTGKGDGGSGQTIKAEFSDTPHIAGTVSMARMPDDPDSADSQFFIVKRAQPDFNGKFTVWGHVVHGMGNLLMLPNGTGTREFTVGGQTLTAHGYVSDPLKIHFARVGSPQKIMTLTQIVDGVALRRALRTVYEGGDELIIARGSPNNGRPVPLTAVRRLPKDDLSGPFTKVTRITWWDIKISRPDRKSVV